MSEFNPYAPPEAVVAKDAGTEAAPALWNPTAAGAWSLLFSPIFGAYLHMQNWKALGQPQQAAVSRNWIFGSIAFFIVLGFSSFFISNTEPLDTIGRFGSLALLVAWYYAIGKTQQTQVAARFGKQYPRRSWKIPILSAIGILIAYLGFFSLLTFLLILAGVIPAT